MHCVWNNRKCLDLHYYAENDNEERLDQFLHGHSGHSWHKWVDRVCLFARRQGPHTVQKESFGAVTQLLFEIFGRVVWILLLNRKHFCGVRTHFDKDASAHFLLWGRRVAETWLSVLWDQFEMFLIASNTSETHFSTLAFSIQFGEFREVVVAQRNCCAFQCKTQETSTNATLIFFLWKFLWNEQEQNYTKCQVANLHLFGKMTDKTPTLWANALLRSPLLNLRYASYTCLFFLSAVVLWTGAFPLWVGHLTRWTVDPHVWSKCKLTYFLTNLSRHLSSALLVLMTAEKFLAMYLPLKVRVCHIQNEYRTSQRFATVTYFCTWKIQKKTFVYCVAKTTNELFLTAAFTVSVSQQVPENVASWSAERFFFIFINCLLSGEKTNHSKDCQMGLPDHNCCLWDIWCSVFHHHDSLQEAWCVQPVYVAVRPRDLWVECKQV